jgi:3-hydroxyacyl-CoA dehydrogenase/3-hydroxy-2-methylbutyryl-CoA dehydrogenase
MEIKNSVIVITGGASGLGQATAQHLAAAGARGIAVLDAAEPKTDALAKEIGSDRYMFCKVDITDADAVREAMAAFKAKFGAVHAVVNAAAIATPAKLISKGKPIDMAKFRKVIEVNVYGTVHVMSWAAMAMLENAPNEDGERGVVINVSSGAAYEGQTGQAAYSASKAAVVGMTFPLMRELATHGIRVMAIAPGMFDTPIYETLPPAVREDLISKAQFPKRMGHPKEFAMLVEEILRNPMHNGRTIRFDAGFLLP